MGRRPLPLERTNELLPLDMTRPPDEVVELDPLTHASEPDPDGFADSFSITPLTSDSSLG